MSVDTILSSKRGAHQRQVSEQRSMDQEFSERAVACIRDSMSNAKASDYGFTLQVDCPGNLYCKQVLQTELSRQIPEITVHILKHRRKHNCLIDWLYDWDGISEGFLIGSAGAFFLPVAICVLLSLPDYVCCTKTRIEISFSHNNRAKYSYAQK